MGFIIAIWAWLKHLVQLPANLAKIASMDKYLELKKELFETQKKLEKAEKQLAKYAAIKAGRLFLSNNMLWVRDENGEVEIRPYCSRCFEKDGHLIHLLMLKKEGGYFGSCPECKVETGCTPLDP